MSRVRRVGGIVNLGRQDTADLFRSIGETARASRINYAYQTKLLCKQGFNAPELEKKVKLSLTGQVIPECVSSG